MTLIVRNNEEETIMAAPPIGVVRSLLRPIPREVVGMAGFAGAIFAVVSAGAEISSHFTEPSAWLFAAAYGGPGAVAFALYWLVTRKPI